MSPDGAQQLAKDAASDDEPDFCAVVADPAGYILPSDRGEERSAASSSSSASATSSSASTPIFAKQLCNCKLHKGNPCHTQFSASDIEDCRLQYLSLSQSREEYDIAILAKIECFIHTEDTIRSSKKCETLSNKKRQKTRLQYCHHGHSICRTFFMHMHCIGKDKLDALIAHYKLSGVEARQHKNSKRKPAKALSYEDTRRVLDFILNYSEVNGIQLPGRTPKHWKTDGRLLPTNVTKKTVYDEYFLSCQRGNFHNVKICTFRKLWQQLYPFVRTLLPASDLCWTCQSASYKIAEAANKSDEHKQQIIRDLQAHHDLVKQEREHYKTVVEGTRDCVSTCLSENESPTINHVSFDFAQQVHYPCDPLQPGPIFFKTQRKRGLFGLNSEPLGTQVNYLINEAHACGK